VWNNYGVENGHSPVVSAVQLQTELMPAQKYRFAIERDETGYTLEIEGNFRFVGKRPTATIVPFSRTIIRSGIITRQAKSMMDLTTTRGPMKAPLASWKWLILA